MAMRVYRIAAARMIFLNDLDEARGEEADGDDGRDELDETQNALEPQVGSGVAEPLVCALDAHGER
jgi:hypothetical protein